MDEIKKYNEVMEERPNPDNILHMIKNEEKEKNRGKLKIFFGYAAGVGKTYAMLDAAHEAKKKGIDVLVGYIEPHTRPETLALLKGLEILPSKKVIYRGIAVNEFDLDAALYKKSQLILVDELAHSNVEGSRHKKRWQDIEELLDAGIDVYTTVNVQHLESLNDVVASITNVFVKETIPDKIFDTASQIELIDIEAEELLKRFKEGKIYKKEHADRARVNFFTKDNLYALREIALRRTADRVSQEIEISRLAKGDINILPTNEQLLVCISSSPANSKVIRTAARMAEYFHGKWIALYIETSKDKTLKEKYKKQLVNNFKLAEKLGAEIVTIQGLNVAEEIIRYAKLRNITKIIIGKNQSVKRSVTGIYRRDLVDKLINSTSYIDIHVIPSSSKDYGEQECKRGSGGISTKVTWKDTVITAVVIILANIISLFFSRVGLIEGNIIMVYIIAVFLVSVSTRGYVMGIVASVLGVLSFNYLFTDPVYTFIVNETDYIITLVITLVVALITSTLTTKMQVTAEISLKRAEHTQKLYEISREFLNVSGIDEIIKKGLDNIAKGLERDTICYIFKEKDKLSEPYVNEKCDKTHLEVLSSEYEKAVAHWSLSSGKYAGAGTDTLPISKAKYIPVKGQNDTLAVIGIYCGDNPIDHEQQFFVETVLVQMALAIDREILSEEKESSKREIERERLRSNLLRAISHDIRTPLTGISGASSLIIESGDKIDKEVSIELIKGIYDDAEWLIRLVENLLSMTRIDEGKLEVKKSLEVVEDIVAGAIGRVKKRAVYHKIKVNMPQDILVVSMDGKLIEQVLINLIDNGIKYTPDGSIITVDVYKRKKEVVFQVSDNGEGLSQESIKQLFDRFYTGEGKMQDARRGVGLGLAICKSIVTAHGGKIEAMNNKSGGAMFRFTLPMESN